MKKMFVLIVVLVLLVAGAVVVIWLRSGPDPSQFADRRDPRLTRMSDQKMLVVEATGDPNLVAPRSFKLLFRTYFNLEGVSRARPPAPRARWPRSLDTPRDEWLGRYALPVPQNVTTLPSARVEPGFSIGIVDWAYGEVAEILHVGPYSEERADITRLQEFIAAQGYRIVGEHEEEYIRGPGMFFAGDPKKYITIIRLRVVKAGRAETSHGD